MVEPLLAYALLLWKAWETGWTAEQLHSEAPPWSVWALPHNHPRYEFVLSPPPYWRAELTTG